MNTGALITMVATHVILKAPKKPEPDSYSDNDDD